MIKPTISRRRVLAAACLAPIAGCSLISDPPAPQMYRLDPADLDPAPTQPRHDSLVIGLPTAPQNLDSDRIALTRGAARFDYYADSTWTDRVPPLLQALLVEAFETDGRIADVWTDRDVMSAGYLLETTVRSFTARYDGADASLPVVDVSLDLRLVRLPAQQSLGRNLLAEQCEAKRNDLPSIVMAFDVAAGKALNRCVAWTLSTMHRT